MSKRKPAKRKTGKKPAAILAKPLRALGKHVLQSIPALPVILSFEGPSRARTEIQGVPLPPDLEPAVRYYAGQEYCSLGQDFDWAPWEYANRYGEADPPLTEEDFPGWQAPILNAENWQSIRDSLELCFRQGFYLALTRYADDLKHVPEAVALRKTMRRNSWKGGEARRKKAEPTHRAIRKRFRELRKESPKKTARYLRVAEEFGISDRHVARIVDGLD